jgi:ATPase subunit of ABC transporter with duplicated ATPase domains
LGELEGIVAEENGYEAEAAAAVLLDGLGVPQELHSGIMGEQQAATKVRVLLAQALFGEPDALLLDEPTNGLDMDAIIWLEDFLVAYHGALILISHDRRFLNAVCDHIADIDYETIITYTGNYDDMVRQKAQVRGRVEKENAAREKKVAQLQEFVARFAAGTRSSQTRSRQKEIERLKPEEIKRSNIARPFIRFPVSEQSGRDVLKVDGLGHAYGDHVIFSGFHADVQRGDKVAILGRNGVGKTTLVRALLDPANAASGAARWGHNTNIGVFGHDHRDQITPGMTAYQWLFQHRPQVGEQHIRGILGRMLFSNKDGEKPTATLSGGEAARLVMCKLILLEHNVLVLDEPTDHLDLESCSSLREAIEAYEGTMFFVTDLPAAGGAHPVHGHARGVRGLASPVLREDRVEERESQRPVSGIPCSADARRRAIRSRSARASSGAPAAPPAALHPQPDSVVSSPASQPSSTTPSQSLSNVSRHRSGRLGLA